MPIVAQDPLGAGSPGGDSSNKVFFCTAFVFHVALAPLYRPAASRSHHAARLLIEPPVEQSATTRAVSRRGRGDMGGDLRIGDTVRFGATSTQIA